MAQFWDIVQEKPAWSQGITLESQANVKNPSAADVAAAQSIVLDDIARILNGQPFTTGSSAANASQSSIPATATTTSTGNTANHDNGTDSPISDNK
jgi:hypothetical protein